MTDDEYDRCCRVLTSVTGLHNWRQERIPWECARRPWGMKLTTGRSLDTWDMDWLTRMVVAAHGERVRLEVSGARRGRLQILLHPRKAEGSGWERHPGLDHLAALCESYGKRRANPQANQVSDGGGS